MYRLAYDECAVCNARLAVSNPKLRYVECPKCHTVYDLKDRKIDNTKTQVSPADCRHRARTLIKSSRGVTATPGHMSYSYGVWLCRDCGQFEVKGWKNGQSYSVEFTLCRDDDLHAAGQWVRLLQGEGVSDG